MKDYVVSVSANIQSKATFAIHLKADSYDEAIQQFHNRYGNYGIQEKLSNSLYSDVRQGKAEFTKMHIAIGELVPSDKKDSLICTNWRVVNNHENN